MLYRKRAWDIMRSEFPSVGEAATLSQVIETMGKSLLHNADHDFVMVKTSEGKFVGIITMWNIIQAMGPDLLKKTVKSKDDENFEKAFRLACQLGAQTGIKKMIQKNFPRIKSNDTLSRIIEAFLDYNQGTAVVEEGEKIIGVVIMADVYKEIARNI
jgi:predicted transcriptional regulator